MAGFIIQLIGKDPQALHLDDGADRPLCGRTALTMPIHNEGTQRVAAGLDVMWSSLQALPEQAAFDLFILSDSRDPAIADAEEKAWHDLVMRHGADGRLFYRRRKQNVGRKAGNIAEFVRSWGGAYDYMIVLDADSVMSGGAFVTLARMMDAHPEVGIIQALPLPTGRETLFARLVQFAARLSSPMMTSGMVFWQLGEGNYWGHNAILRLRPFAGHCALPSLPGTPPLGGEILSHDFVEGGVHAPRGMASVGHGRRGRKLEEIPSNILDYAARDRRWAQGNLQHLRLLPLKGLHWVSRLHLITGVLSYVVSPLWFAALILSSFLVCRDAIHGHEYFTTERAQPVSAMAGGPRIADRRASGDDPLSAVRSQSSGHGPCSECSVAPEPLWRCRPDFDQCPARATVQYCARTDHDVVSHRIRREYARRTVRRLGDSGARRPRNRFSAGRGATPVARTAGPNLGSHYSFVRATVHLVDTATSDRLHSVSAADGVDEPG